MSSSLSDCYPRGRKSPENNLFAALTGRRQTPMGAQALIPVQGKALSPAPALKPDS